MTIQKWKSQSQQEFEDGELVNVDEEPYEDAFDAEDMDFNDVMDEE